MDFLVKVPEALSDVAILLEPLSIAEKAIFQSFRIQDRMTWEPQKALVTGAGPLGLLVAILLRLRGLEVYVAATRTKESLKARLVRSVGGTYINVRETPIRTLQEKFDLVFEATGRVDVALDTLNLLDSNSIMCILGIYREMKACQKFGNVLTNMVLGNRLIFGSVSSNKSHFRSGINDMKVIKQKYGNILEKVITKRVSPPDFKQAFKPEREDIKTVICFQ